VKAPAGWLESLVCAELRRHRGDPVGAAPTRRGGRALRRLAPPVVLMAALAEGSGSYGRRARPGAGSTAGPSSERGAGTSSQPARAAAGSSVGSPTADSCPTLKPGEAGPPSNVGVATPRDVSATRLDVMLARDREAPRVARRLLAQWLCRQVDEREVGDAPLLVSELVTNALLHGQGTIEMHARLDENHLIVEVIDHGKGFERVVRERDFDRVGGWGLSLVDALASRWGIHAGASRVWFELERSRPGLRQFNEPHA